LVRDRFLSVGLRRSIQIAKPQPTLCISDFESEMDRSEVHSAETKQLLARLFIRANHLSNVLTDLLLLLWPPDDHLGLQSSANALIECRAALQEWYDKTQLEISAANGGNRIRQHSVIVHTNHVYMFYQYASRTICLPSLD
jgi:hypothetical protein